MLTNLVRELDDHDLSVLHTRNTQNGLVGVACVNPLHKIFSPTVKIVNVFRINVLTRHCKGSYACVGKCYGCDRLRTFHAIPYHKLVVGQIGDLTLFPRLSQPRH